MHFLLYSIGYIPHISCATKEHISNLEKTTGIKALYDILTREDKNHIDEYKISSKNRYWILRASSVLHETGKSITSYSSKNKVAHVSLFNNYFMFICNPDWENLYKQCNKCCSYLMNEAGIKEVKKNIK